MLNNITWICRACYALPACVQPDDMPDAGMAGCWIGFHAGKQPVAASMAAPSTAQMATDSGTDMPKVKGARSRPGHSTL